MLRKPLPDVLKGMADHRKPCYCYFSQSAGIYVLGVFIPGVANNHSNSVYRREKEKGIIEYRISNIKYRISDIGYRIYWCPVKIHMDWENTCRR